MRNLVPAEGVSTYTASYSSMLEDVDDVDSLAGLRLRGESSDQSLNAAIEKAQKSYASFVDAVDKLVEVSAIAPASLPAVTATD